MSRLIWTPGASVGLERAYLFLAEKDEEAAVKALDAIDSGSLLLEKFPEAGRPAEDLSQNTGNYLFPLAGLAMFCCTG